MTTTPDQAGRTRKGICWAVLLFTIPYLGLKVLWVCGVDIGVHGSVMRGGTMATVNLATIGMDVIAAVVSVGLVRPWGLRVPAWLLIFPMWVATGFLAPIVFGAPAATLAGALFDSGGASGQIKSSADGVAPWVFNMVYTGFILQGLGLAAGFLLHARARWGHILRWRLRDLPTGPLAGVHRTMAAGVGAFALIPSLVNFYWAAGGPGSLYDDAHAATRLVLHTVFGLLPLVGMAGMLVVTRRRDAAPARRPLIAAWTGTASSFSWGLWWLATGAVQSKLSGGHDMHALMGVGAMMMLAGAVLATVLALLVVEAEVAPPRGAGNGAAHHASRRIDAQ